ncbi:hypothetical protein ACVLD2_001770 [Paenibacillus sp. PvR052]
MNIYHNGLLVVNALCLRFIYKLNTLTARNYNPYLLAYLGVNKNVHGLAGAVFTGKYEGLNSKAPFNYPNRPESARPYKMSSTDRKTGKMPHQQDLPCRSLCAIDPVRPCID